MPQSIKQIKNRIRSVENTKKVTGAMQMISVAKLNRIEDRLFSLRPYCLKLENIMYDLSASTELCLSEYFQGDPKVADVVLCLITSDSGLCGVYNQNIIRAAEEFLEKHGGERVKLILAGQKGLSYFKGRSIEIINAYTGLNAKYAPEPCDKVIAQLSSLFLGGRVSSVHLAYTYFNNSIIQKATIERLLPLELKKAKPEEYIAEPDLQNILAEIIPYYLKIKMRLVFLESFTSEHAARTVSMKTATDNAKELLEGLVLLRNKVRQAGITQDILELTSSVEALRG
ncbi:ATP synthase F1 subunit gamma [bacterium]|nr:MAG: ATP synthase F1 subunit gamma [bacterium]